MQSPGMDGGAAADGQQARNPAARSRPPSARKRTSTALHALAAETPTAKAKVRDHTDTGDVRP